MAAVTSAAHASSFVSVGTPRSTPSIVSLSASPPGQAIVASAPKDSPLIQMMQVELAAPAPGELPPEAASWRTARSLERHASASPSIVALGEPSPDIAYEKVAAIPASARHPAHAAPLLIIRGGIVGDAFSAPSAPVAIQAQATAKPQQSAAAAPPDGSPATPAPTPAPAAAAPPPTAVRE